MYYLDTNICVYYLNGRYDSVRKKILQTIPKIIRIPAIVKAELLAGAFRSQYREKTLEMMNTFLKPYDVESFTDEAVYAYAEIHAYLTNKGCLIGPNDMFIAATVLANKGTLVTNNIKEFSRIPGLSLENWTE
ncbi:MAG: type II toxin-antitoxin system VapC family toxin [Lachnospiraceae bacterium]|nr:type II toxin-antitoxin system VapC family toxin [Lachnospiraceae bacterium]